jgi:hypothetical protein
MKPIVIGNPEVFAIESSITEAFDSAGRRALGYFVISVAGKSYGVRSPTATLLACSFDAVERRIQRRGTHCLPFELNVSAAEVVDVVRAALYEDSRQNGTYFGHTAEQFEQLLTTCEIVWAPDGDAAFDDGGHVIQLDQGAMVRLIAFKNAAESRVVAGSIREVYMLAPDFYGVLESWVRAFEMQWGQSLASTRH